MNSKILIKNALIINEGKIIKADLLIENESISKIAPAINDAHVSQIIDAEGLYLLPGMIDDQVHFREPGLTHKADIHSESRAAVAGGITSFMEMPNTKPNAVTQVLLEDKYVIAAKNSFANYSFYMGATNDNLEEVLKTDPEKVCGVKVFMGSSTGNMLVDDEATLEKLFSSFKGLIATHCEDENTIRKNEALARAEFGEDVPIKMHPIIRSAEACYLSSSKAVSLAKKTGARLHVLHISTQKELSLFDNKAALKDKKITAEACIHHLWFDDSYYESKGSLIKWNPAVKTKTDRDAILKAVIDNRIDVIATDHAPHTLEEKENTYFKAPSGGPLVQHALLALFDLWKQNKISLESIVQKTSHNLAELFRIKKRGFIKEGYFADLVLIDPNASTEVKKDNLLYKCGWSPFEGHRFGSKIKYTFVNGQLVYNDGTIDEKVRGKRLTFKI
jgi:dihydroorotase